MSITPVALNSFTPEYSNELLLLIEDIYVSEIKPHVPQLRLSKLLDLVEHASYLFESYTNALSSKKDDDALTAFIVGCYYLYLIIPQSSQFQTKNKSHNIYNTLKALYQNEVHMTNVLAMVKDSVDKILEERIYNTSNANAIKRNRAYSLPDTKLDHEMLSLQLSNVNENSGIPNDKMKSYYNDAPLESDYSSMDDIDDTTPLWTAPPLEPNDQLKLALDSASQLPVISKTQSFDTKPYGSLHRVGNISPIYEVEKPFPESIDDQKHDVDVAFGNLLVDRSITHRKDSYHSVYMPLEENENTVDEHDFANDYIQTLDRLQKQNVITCPELYSILSSPMDNRSLLLVDLRLTKRSKSNFIISENIIEIDPHLLWDKSKNKPISKLSELQMVINNPLTSKLQEFNYIVYYTDLKTTMYMEFDYLFIFFYIMVSSTELNLKAVPTNLLGGFEKWKKVLRTYARDYRIDTKQYIHKPLTEFDTRLHTTKNDEHANLINRKPPDIPLKIRKRPPPPPPVSIPSTPIVSYSGTATASNYPYIEETYEIAPKIPKRPGSSHYNNGISNHHYRSPTKKTYQPSIPTIEKSSNKYVSLSITGLRNLGNTCYINSMLQCLFATTELRNLFVSSQYEQFINKKVTQSKSLSKSFSILFKKMYLNGGCSVVPTGFLKTCNQLRPDLRIPDDQQDTQEFLMLMLDRLHDELSDQQAVANAYPDLILYDSNKLQVHKSDYEKWFEKTNLRNGLSPIGHIFQGQMENSLNCQRCGYISYSYSTFYVLSLAIPKPSSSTFSRSKRVKLEDCINMFTSDELLAGENAWDCSRCGPSVMSKTEGNTPEPPAHKSTESTSIHKHHRRSKFFLLPAKKPKSERSTSPTKKPPKHSSDKWKSRKLITIKSFNFIAMPPVLVIHLSRFYYDGSKKNETVITYPLILNIVLKNDETVQYRLYAIVNHTGNLTSGHYTTLVNKDKMHDLGKDTQKWYYFDDEVVKQETNHGNIDEGVIKISSSHVYVLFYERI